MTTDPQGIFNIVVCAAFCGHAFANRSYWFSVVFAGLLAAQIASVAAGGFAA